MHQRCLPERKKGWCVTIPHRRSLISQIKRLVKETAYFDRLERELICTYDFYGPKTGYQIRWQGEVLKDRHNRGSLQDPR